MKNKNRIVFLGLLASITATAQFSNTGTVIVNPNTVMGMVSDFNNTEKGTLLNDGDLHLYADFNNDGLTTFTPSEQGNVRFEGFSKQKVTGEFLAEFKNVHVNNTSAVPVIELHNEISVAGNANFNHGIVSDEIGGGFMTFEEDATYSNYSDKSHVDGVVVRNGSKEFIFPVGNKGFNRYSKIEGLKDVLSSYTSRYFYENSGLKFPHSSKKEVVDVINDQEYWTVEKKKGNDATAILTLSWDEYTTTPANIVISPEEDIRIIGWDPVEKIWKDNGGIVDAVSKTVTTPVNLGGFSAFTLGRLKEGRIIGQPCNKLVVYNAISPNGDGKNDYLRIEGLENCSVVSNKVAIYNRWGAKVFETDNYGANGNVFTGYSEGPLTLSKGQLLPSGTYFYTIDLEYKDASNSSQGIKKVGYLYLR